MLIVDEGPLVKLWVEEALEDMRQYSHPPKYQHDCYTCGATMRYAVGVRQCDLDDFNKLISIAREYLDGMGLTRALLDSVRKKAMEALESDHE